MPQPRQPRPGSTPARPRKALPRVEEQPRHRPRAAAAATPRGPLSPSQKRYLRGFAHALKPVILVGQKGITAAVLSELDGALAHHELIKVKLADGDRESRAASIDTILASSGAELVQRIGHIACFYRANPDQSAFTLPK